MASYTRTELDAALQAAADAVGEPLTKAAYQTYRADQQPQDTPMPAAETIVSGAAGYGSWRAACRANGIDVASPGPEPVSISDRVRALRAAAADCGEPLTKADYDAWRADRSDAPMIGNDSRTAPQGINGWSDWCVLAGVRPGKRDIWTPLECLYALRLADRDTSIRCSEATYQEWRASRDGLYPSPGACRRHWPSFTAARAIALGQPEDVPPEAWDEA